MTPWIVWLALNYRLKGRYYWLLDYPREAPTQKFGSSRKLMCKVDRVWWWRRHVRLGGLVSDIHMFVQVSIISIT
jgi:hypothetical protein